MDKDSDEPRVPKEPKSGEPEAPPFEPDPRLVTYLERGRKDDAERRFREGLRDDEDRD